MSKYYHVSYRRNKGHRLRRFTMVTILTLIFVAGGLSVHNEPKEGGIAVSKAEEVSAEKQKAAPALPWPSYGHSAYGEMAVGVLAKSDENDKPVPVASLAKVITALAILEKKPLAPGEQGPIITLDDRDVALYGEYLSKNGAVVLVEPGEQITQYQAMQAMLMSSANNISDSLARWAFGSVEGYTIYANEMLKQLGLENTVVADASGFSPSTVSTSADITKLGILYMEHPVLREIAMQREANIPVAGLIKNYNAAINEKGIVGIKVGHTDEAGRCFLVAYTGSEGNAVGEVSVVAVLGAEELRTAMVDAKKILEAGKAQD